MARARNIKPSFFKNELLAELHAFDRLLFIGLWCLADREGRIEDRHKRIKMELFPCDTYDVDHGLNELARCNFINRYVAGGGGVIEIVNFLKHQTPHGSERDSELPDQSGVLTVNERNDSGYITGKKRRNNVNLPKDNVDPPDKTSAEQVNPPDGTSEPTRANHPDILNPDILNPESGILNPDTHSAAPVDNSGAPDSLRPVCVVLENSGIQGVNILDPEFTRLTSDSRITVGHWQWAASHAVQKSNPKFAFVLGIVRNRVATEHAPPADVARTTTPAPPGIDPTLAKLDREAPLLKTMPADFRAKLADLKRGSAAH